MFRTAAGIIVSHAIMASMAWGQTPAPTLVPDVTTAPLESAESSTALQPATPTLLAAPSDNWIAQDPRQPVTMQPEIVDPGNFSTAPPVLAAPFSYGEGPSFKSDYSQDVRCCDPGKEFILKMLGLDQEPTYVPGYYDPFSTQFAYGAAGFIPYQLGWYNKQELAYVPRTETQPGLGPFNFTEWNSFSRYAARMDDRHVFAWTFVWNARLLNGPSGIGLESDVSVIQSDFQISSSDPGPWNWQIGFTPQMNSDFRRQLTSDAYMFDARAVLFNKLSPQWTLAMGLAYWDRNHGNIIPYGGVIWTPDDRWEFKAMFPKSRISYFAGSVQQFDVWLYGSAEYTLDAYQVDLSDTGLKTRMELQDYRFMLGINAARPRFSAYFEGGYITDRHVNFRGPTQDFGIGDAWIIRSGLTF